MEMEMGYGICWLWEELDIGSSGVVDRYWFCWWVGGARGKY